MDFLSLDESQGPSRVTEADISQHAYEIPSLQMPSSQASSHGSDRGRSASRHGRSMSHPFPSIFQSRRRRHGDNSATTADAPDPELPNVQRATSSKPSKSPDDRELMTGTCMTCDSTVRWPKDIAVFRCTVCLTINDLKTPIISMSPGCLRRAAAPPLSTEKTKALVEQCIVAYLRDRLEHGPRGLEEQVESPSPQSSGKGDPEETACICKESETVEEAKNIPIITEPNHIVEPRSGNDGKSNSNHPAANSDTNVFPTSIPSTDNRLLNDGESHIDERQKCSTKDPDLGSDENTPARDPDGDTRRDGTDVVIKNIFKALEEYIITSFKSRECINNSFTFCKTGTSTFEPTRRRIAATTDERQCRTSASLSTMDVKTLPIVVGLADPSPAGREREKTPARSRLYKTTGSTESPSYGIGIVNPKSPLIDWAELRNWYHTVLYAGVGWERHLDNLPELDQSKPSCNRLTKEDMQEVEKEMSDARLHTRRVLLKATEGLLKRPGATLRDPDDVRFLLIILENPLLYPSKIQDMPMPMPIPRQNLRSRPKDHGSAKPLESSRITRGPGQHSGIIKRVFGLLSNLPNECHHYLVGWFTRFSESHFREIIGLVGTFVTYRMTRQRRRKRFSSQNHVTELIPSINVSGREISSALQTVLGVPGQSAKKPEDRSIILPYSEDWQLKAAARVMSLLFAANITGTPPRNDVRRPSLSNITTGYEPSHRHGSMIPLSEFYNLLLDYSDLVADFEAWETKKSKFTFCQYPFFLSIWAKIQIMEHDTHRQMEVKAREAFFDSIMTRKTVNQYLILKIRRECLVEDSLKGVSEVVGIGRGEVKKGLRIQFKGEEGIDAGGLRKEWFLLLVRDLLNPEYGMFTYDEDSQFCYFNPDSFESSDQFFLVGVVLGLAIYNSTILDIPLPHFAFRKLLAAGPKTASWLSQARSNMTYSLEDLAEFRPALARGLKQLLEYTGDVENTYCRNFVADIERYGQVVQIPLCPGGEEKPVTRSNRREFVDLYVRYLLDSSVSRQFEPFKRGFFTVCEGNALSLFRPEEIELLVRGSDEQLDISSLRAVAVYENWGVRNPAETEVVVSWFWKSFENANPESQRKLLGFITGSDRIPATGPSNLVIKLTCLGGDSPRFPTARTCFNAISLWRYDSYQKLDTLLWRAVNESEGFGLK